MGPDGRIYAGTMDGEIVRFDVKPDGTLGAPTVITTIIDNNGGLPRIITGLRFDPNSTPSDFDLWVTHGDGLEVNAPDFSGKLTRLRGPNLADYQDFITELPRSVRDHLTQQMDFGPDKALYISQGSNSSMGAPDNAWGQRPEDLLSASILRVNLLSISKIIDSTGQALSVRTDGAPGTTPYDPYAKNAPVTLYATGVRNAFDLLWHSNGHLYAPTNGSAPGGNTPAGPGVPALTNVAKNEPDWLFDIKKGKYYGHPNPLREEYVYNGGNPTSGVDPMEVTAYKVGTKPDSNLDPAVYVFGDNRSPDGTIEYKSNTFFGQLKGAMIVTEYSGGNDLVVIKPNADGSIDPAKVYRGMPGTTGFVDPLDLTENKANGNLYVVEYGANRITLLRVKDVAPQAPRDIGQAVFNDPVDGTSGARSARSRSRTRTPSRSQSRPWRFSATTRTRSRSSTRRPRRSPSSPTGSSASRSSSTRRRTRRSASRRRSFGSTPPSRRSSRRWSSRSAAWPRRASSARTSRRCSASSTCSSSPTPSATTTRRRRR
jgi:glucose/arabinose dehydrogenase